jgi:hypothetical protein
MPRLKFNKLRLLHRKNNRVSQLNLVTKESKLLHQLKLLTKLTSWKPKVNNWYNLPKFKRAETS